MFIQSVLTVLCNSYLHQSDLPGNLSWTRWMNIKWEKKRVSRDDRSLKAIQTDK